MAEDKTALDPFGVMAQAQAQKPLARPETAAAEEQLIGQLEDVLKDARKVRLEVDLLVNYNRAFLAGYQLGGIDLLTSDYLRIVTQRSPNKFPSIDNKLLPTYRAYIGKHLKSFGLPSVRSFNDTYTETKAAEGMATYLDYVHTKEKMVLKLKRAIGTTAMAPIGYFKLYWDRDGGDKVAACPTCKSVEPEENAGKPCQYCMQQAILQMDAHHAAVRQEQQNHAIIGQIHAPVAHIAHPAPDLNKTPMLILARTGETKIDTRRWEDIFADPAALTPEKVQYYFDVRPVPLNEVRMKYPDQWEVIKADDIVVDQYLYHDPRTNKLVRSMRRAHDHVLLREYNEGPSGLFPNGRIITYTTDKILDVTENIYWKLNGRLNLYDIRGDVLDDSVNGLPWLSQAVSIQRERNKLRSQVRAHRELTLNPRWVYQLGSGITKKTLDETPGEGIGVLRNTAIQPYYLRQPNLPTFVVDEQNYMDESIREKAGVTEHEMGQVSSDQSGRYAAFIESQSSQTMQAISVENSAEWLALWDGVLQLGYHFQDSNKTWLSKRGGRSLKMSWATIGLKPKLGSVYIAEEEMLSKNPVLRLSFAERLAQDGMFIDSETGRPNPAKFAAYAGLQGLANSDVEEAARKYAARIPEMLKQGQQVIPMPWDRVKIIADELCGWLQSESLYEDPQLVQMVGQTWLAFSQAVMNNMRAMGMPPSPDIVASLPNAPPPPPPGMAPPGQPAQGAPGAQPQPPKTNGPQDSQQAATHTAETTARPGQQHEGSPI